MDLRRQEEITLNSLHPIRPNLTTSAHPWSLKKFFLWAAVFAGLSAVAITADVEFTRYCRKGDLSGDLRRVMNLSEIFAHGFGILICVSLVWTLGPHLRKFLPRLLCIAILPGLAVQLIKLYIVRRRPSYFKRNFADYVNDTWLGLDTANTEYLTQSFPSAHTATAFGLAIAMSWILPRGKVVFFAFAVLASFQRIIAGAHWLSDVFAGVVIAFVVSGLLFQNWGLGWVLNRIENRKNTAHCETETQALPTAKSTANRAA